MYFILEYVYAEYNSILLVDVPIKSYKQYR